MSTWGAIGSTAYNTQYSLMANTIQSSVYAFIASTIFASNMNITVTGFTQKSTSRRQLLTPTLTAAYTGQPWSTSQASIVVRPCLYCILKT